MEKIVQSLTEHKLNREIKQLLQVVQPMVPSKDMKRQFFEMYKKGVLNEQKFIYFDTRIVLGEFCLQIENALNSDKAHVGIWFFDEQELKIYFAAGPNVPYEIINLGNETNVDEDLEVGCDYVYNTFIVQSLDKDPRINKYRKTLQTCGYNGLISQPINFDGKIVGMIDVYLQPPFYITNKHIKKIKSYEQDINEKINEIKQDMITIMQNKKAVTK